jgi:hypothetical protein
MRYCQKIKDKYWYSFLDPEDYVQECLLVASKKILEYVFICPECRERFQTESELHNHCIDKHNQEKSPLVCIETYVSIWITKQILNLRAFQRAKKRNISTTINAGLEVFIRPELRSCRIEDNPLQVTESRQIQERIEAKLQAERNQNIRIFVNRLVQGGQKNDAYQDIADQGLASSTESARVNIYNIQKRTRLFDPYRKILKGM